MLPINNRMNLINADISHEKMLDLFRTIHNLHFKHKTEFDRTHLVERICKCHNLDVKIYLRMYITYSGDEMGNFAISVKVSAGTNCVNLRKYKTYFGDDESFTILKEFQAKMSESEITEEYKNLIKKIIESYNVFKVCRYCRLLYRDPRVDIEPDYPCMNCLFDQVFHIRELNCVVCSEMIQKDEMNFTLTCGHTYHTNCIMKTFVQMRKRECPLCREIDCHDII